MEPACVEVGIFDRKRKSERFSVRNRGAGQSSYLMEDPMFDQLCDMNKLVQPVRGTTDSRDAAAALSTDGWVVVRSSVAERYNASWCERTASVLERLEPRARADAVDCPLVRHFDEFNGHAILHSPERRDIWPWDAVCPGADQVGPYLSRLTGLSALVCKTVGLLSVDAGCKTYGRWHRDSSQLFEIAPDAVANDAANVVLPDYYFTVFFPLDALEPNEGNGVPEFITGSHRQGIGHYLTGSHHVAQPRCSPSEMIIINGKLIHRGTPNRAGGARRVLYAVFAPRWYDEEVV